MEILLIIFAYFFIMLAFMSILYRFEMWRWKEYIGRKKK
jgi:hypothetical protein